jgi:putative SbcD/Mre11-related phosphoesterase
MRFSDDWLLLPQRLALHEPSATAVLADVHLGYSAARQRQGDAIPCRSVAEELAPLARAAQTHAITALVVAGDLFERGYDESLCRQFLDVLAGLRIDLAGLVPGNHDRGIDRASIPLPLCPDGFAVAGWRIVHGDQPLDGPRRIMGHWHPAVRQRGRKLPCFLARGDCLVLPAFSLDAAGVDVRRDPRWSGWNCLAVSGDRVMRAA